MRHDAAVVGLVDHQLHPCRAGGSEADLEHDPVERHVLDHLGGVVHLGAGEPDGVVELAAFGRPVRVDAAHPPGADDPARIGVGVVEHVEHRLGRCGDRRSGCGTSAAGEQRDGAIGSDRHHAEHVDVESRVGRARRRGRRPAPARAPGARSRRRVGSGALPPGATPGSRRDRRDRRRWRGPDLRRTGPSPPTGRTADRRGRARTTRRPTPAPRAARTARRRRPSWRPRSGAPTHTPTGSSSTCTSERPDQSAAAWPM